jgi:tyrosine-protein phosphatase SIW14
MTLFTRLAFWLLLVTASICCPAQRDVASRSQQNPSAEKIQIHGISDAGRVSEYLYRGAQPSAEGVEQLKKLGIDTIVDLRGERPVTLEKERKHAESLGIQLINIPGNGWSPPTDEQIAQFFSLLQQKPRKRVYIHCWFGSDRTGVFIAAYRIAFDRWTPDQALSEMESFHFKGFWHPAMKSYIRDFPARLSNSPTLARFRPPR